jgi:hypothetical protein
MQGNGWKKINVLKEYRTERYEVDINTKDNFPLTFNMLFKLDVTE